MVDLGTKICTRCKKEKFLERFYTKKGGLKGCTSQCMDCVKELEKDRYRAKKA